MTTKTKKSEFAQLNETAELFVDADIVNQVCLLCKREDNKVCLLIISNGFKKTEIVTVENAKKYIIRQISTNSILVFTDGYFYYC